ncbi:MAG: hypothetical protein ABI622_09710, partial [Chloroflexota bacterium]
MRAPESIDQPALTIAQAAGLMSELGFIAFRTPTEATTADSCLMAVVRDTPTGRHFDPQTVGSWVLENGHGRIHMIDHGEPTPVSRPYSWGPIRLVDRFGARNSFVSFGGWLTGERVGRDALLLIFRSSAPILRLPGHSQQRDRLSDEVLAFFSRLVPPMWSHPGRERLVGAIAPEALYATFLLYHHERLESSAALRDATAEDAGVLARELDRVERTQPEALTAGRELL